MEEGDGGVGLWWKVVAEDHGGGWVVVACGGGWQLVVAGWCWYPLYIIIRLWPYEILLYTDKLLHPKSNLRVFIA